jgi:hypothetical protein
MYADTSAIADKAKKGYYVTEGRKKGRPDVERVRLERKAEKLSEEKGKKVSPEEVAKMEAAKKAEEAAKKLKPSRVKR